MTFKPAIWYPIAVVLSVINLVGVGFAAGAAEPWHAAIHAALALAFGLWAQRLRRGPGGSEGQARLEALEAEVSKLGADEDLVARLEAVEQEISSLRQQLSDAHERIDFAERLLVRPRDEGKLAPQPPSQP